MKNMKYVALFLIICLIACFVSCDYINSMDNSSSALTDVEISTEEETKAEDCVEELIREVDSIESYLKAAVSFFKLSPEQQKRVDNAYRLYSEYEYTYDDKRIPDYVNANPDVRDWYMRMDADRISRGFHNSIKNGLANRDSYKVNEQYNIVFYDDEEDVFYLCITVDYSFQNEYGGYTRQTKREVSEWTSDGIRWGWGFDDPDTLIKVFNWEFDVYDRYDDLFYSND